ncbi:hypothetical protein Hte_007864 [Hypoxylon texense]
MAATRHSLDAYTPELERSAPHNLSATEMDLKTPDDSNAKSQENQGCEENKATTNAHTTDMPETPRYHQPVYQYPGQSIDLAEKGIHLEDLEDYRPGGYHPVHIDDVLDGRYHVAHKLGFGGYATVWLCRDTQEKRWNAVKIVTAEKSSEECPELTLRPVLEDSPFAVLPERQFWIDGPNGRHLALVLPVLGPAISVVFQMAADDTAIHKLCRRMAEALLHLHDKGICHGDFRPANILHRMHSIDSLTKHQIWRLLGSPFSSEYHCTVSSKEGGDPGQYAPRYAIRTADMRRLQDWIIEDEIAVVDFGIAFDVSDPPKKAWGIPASYAAPELLFEGQPSFSSDIWALGCSILRLITDEAPENSVRGAVSWMELHLGPLPDEYRLAWDRLYKQGTEEDDDFEEEDDYVYYGDLSWPKIPTDPEMDKRYIVWTERDVQDVMARTEKNGFTDPLNSSVGSAREIGGFGASERREYRMPRGEVLQLTDLLRRMFDYDPDERPDAATILEHPWFTRHDHGVKK